MTVKAEGAVKKTPKIRYLGWSSVIVEADQGDLVFDPFFRPYCGADFSTLDDFAKAKVICVSHGHQDHFLDTPAVVERTEATVVSSQEVCDHLHRRYKVASEKLVPIKPFETKTVAGFEITAFEWRHRDVSYAQGVFGGGILHGIKWAWTALTKVPSFSPCLGFHVRMPGYETITNYSEGFTQNLDLDQAQEVAAKFETDVLLAGANCAFEKFVSEGAAVFRPSTVILYHPHEKLFEKIRVQSTSPEVFVGAVKRLLPAAKVLYAEPGFSTVA
jgi:hypothetical protein